MVFSSHVFIFYFLPAGQHIAGLDRMEQRIRDAMAEGRPAFLRRALTGYIVRKCRE